MRRTLRFACPGLNVGYFDMPAPGGGGGPTRGCDVHESGSETDFTEYSVVSSKGRRPVRHISATNRPTRAMFEVASAMLTAPTDEK
jgi:hypothetical protein